MAMSEKVIVKILDLLIVELEIHTTPQENSQDFSDSDFT